MPQMAPLFWLYLFVFFIISFLFFISMNYFISLFHKSSILFIPTMKEFKKPWKF